MQEYIICTVNANVFCYFFSAKFNELRFDVDSLSPRLEVLGDYTMKGNVLLFPINGIGKCNITLSKYYKFI